MCVYGLHLSMSKSHARLKSGLYDLCPLARKWHHGTFDFYSRWARNTLIQIIKILLIFILSRCILFHTREVWGVVLQNMLGTSLISIQDQLKKISWVYFFNIDFHIFAQSFNAIETDIPSWSAVWLLKTRSGFSCTAMFHGFRSLELIYNFSLGGWQLTRQDGKPYKLSRVTTMVWHLGTSLVET